MNDHFWRVVDNPDWGDLCTPSLFNAIGDFMKTTVENFLSVRISL